MTAALERLEAEFASSLLCATCGAVGESRPATAVAIVREVCAAGGRIPTDRYGGSFLVCREHADALMYFRIAGNRCCSGCGHAVAGESWAHVIERVEPVGLPR